VPRLPDDRAEELRSHVVLHQPLAIRGEGAVVERFLDDSSSICVRLVTRAFAHTRKDIRSSESK
jgi:hypothetical protein